VVERSEHHRINGQKTANAPDGAAGISRAHFPAPLPGSMIFGRRDPVVFARCARSTTG
jgi:hypothetical protein